MNVTKESYEIRIMNLITLAVLELDEEAKGMLEHIRDRCNEILEELEPTEEDTNA